MEPTTTIGRSLLSVSGSSCQLTPVTVASVASVTTTSPCVVLAGYKRMADYKDAISKLIGLHVSEQRHVGPGIRLAGSSRRLAERHQQMRLCGPNVASTAAPANHASTLC
jgi:hypothetical protein